MSKLLTVTKWTLGLVALTGATTVVLVVTLCSPMCGLLLASTMLMVVATGMDS